MSARTATRTFDLQLAIAALRLAASALDRIRTIPVVYGGNRASLFESSPGTLHPPTKPALAAFLLSR